MQSVINVATLYISLTMSMAVRAVPVFLESSPNTYSVCVRVCGHHAHNTYLCLPGQSVFNVLVDFVHSVCYYRAVTRIQGGGLELSQSIQ